jgi:aryl-alcohol dehydrogenase-like predicted oxidoreductase
VTFANFELGPLIVGCGTFGGIGGSATLIGKGLDEAAACATLDETVELGLTMLDTAESYAGGASETTMRRWFTTRDPATTAGLRITTKVAPPRSADTDQHFDEAFISSTFAGSLSRLGVEHVDTLLLHAPHHGTPVAVTLEAMEAVRSTGGCTHLGACNFDLAELTEALDAADRLGVRGYEMIQNGYSLLSPDDDHDVRALCRERGIVYTAFSPLAGGALTGKYRRGEPPPGASRLALRPDGVDELLTPAVHDAIDHLAATATGLGVSCGALAMAWVLHHPDVAAPVSGPSRTSPHLAIAAEALALDVSLAVFDELTARFRDAARA